MHATSSSSSSETLRWSTSRAAVVVGYLSSSVAHKLASDSLKQQQPKNPRITSIWAELFLWVNELLGMNSVQPPSTNQPARTHERRRHEMETWRHSRRIGLVTLTGRGSHPITTRRRKADGTIALRMYNNHCRDGLQSCRVDSRKSLVVPPCDSALASEQ